MISGQLKLHEVLRLCNMTVTIKVKFDVIDVDAISDKKDITLYADI